MLSLFEDTAFDVNKTIPTTTIPIIITPRMIEEVVVYP